ncbi:MAG: sigma-70 family RNA polymerase sigma factor [Betaproteobacteria bacterium]|nr:sigma-70 family RNA polymerase sigma factor [Betaproteobacteria bacterium]
MNSGSVPPLSPERWLEEHGDALYRYALTHLRDEHKAEEAVQETLVAALQARERFSGEASVRTWLVGILKHKVMDVFRHESREVALEEADEVAAEEDGEEDSFAPDGHWSARLADWGDPMRALENAQFLVLLQRCLEGLPPRLARLFWLREVMEEDTEDICKELAITPTNLWTMLHRGRLGLRQCLDKSWVGSGVKTAARER